MADGHAVGCGVDIGSVCTCFTPLETSASWGDPDWAGSDPRFQSQKAREQRLSYQSEVEQRLADEEKVERLNAAARQFRRETEPKVDLSAALPTSDWAGAVHDVNRRETAVKFLRSNGLEPVPDAIDQLIEVFLPCLDIISTRGYHPHGNTWREAGWRGVMTDIRKKAQRLWYRGWINGRFDEDSARDIINFCGFYLRLKNQGKPWGEWGNPGPRAVDGAPE